MTIVVDASVAAKWLIDEADSELAAPLLAEDLIAPSIIRLECANALIRRLRMKELTAEETSSKLDELATLPVGLHPVDEAEAFRLGFLLRHPVFDCAYLALARAQNLKLVTADKRFKQKAVGAGVGSLIELLSET